MSGAAFIHYSTDYVFNGLKGSPYSGKRPAQSVECLRANPSLTVNKLSSRSVVHFWSCAPAGYTACAGIVLSARCWGGRVRKPRLKLVTDQISGPTWARMLAEVTCQLITLGKDDPSAWFTQYRGLYHLAGSGTAAALNGEQQVLQLDPHTEATYRP